jgi:hypothetical protein
VLKLAVHALGAAQNDDLAATVALQNRMENAKKENRAKVGRAAWF